MLCDLNVLLQGQRHHIDVPNHPGIVTMFGIAEHGDYLYFVMALAESSLGQFIEERPRWPSDVGYSKWVDVVVGWAYQIASALHALHMEGHGIIHGYVRHCGEVTMSSV